MTEHHNVRALFAEQQPDIDEQIAHAAEPAQQVERLLDMMYSFDGPVGQLFNRALSDRLETWQVEAAQTGDPSSYILAKLEAIVEKHPALQVALGRRTMRSDSATSLFDDL